LERTLVLVKPDAMQRGLAGEIIARWEQRGLRIVGLKLVQVTEAMAAKHYAEHQGKPFFKGLVQFITSTPVIAAVLEGPGAVQAVRTTNGATNSLEAAPGTIRGDLGIDKQRNLVHASDSPASAARETKIYFKPSELVEWKRVTDPWIMES
jgi:nucleoside-diphosphate kinase